MCIPEALVWAVLIEIVGIPIAMILGFLLDKGVNV